MDTLLTIRKTFIVTIKLFLFKTIHSSLVFPQLVICENTLKLNVKTEVRFLQEMFCCCSNNNFPLRQYKKEIKKEIMEYIFHHHNHHYAILTLAQPLAGGRRRPYQREATVNSLSKNKKKTCKN